MPNNIDFFAVNIYNKAVKQSELEKFVDSVLEKMEITGCELSVTLCDDEYIQKLNRQYRNKDEPTDILTFPMQDSLSSLSQNDDDIPLSAGDIVISLDSVVANSSHFHISPGQELKRVLIHGLLHLAGYSHPSEDYEFRSDMLRKQEELLADYQEVIIYQDHENKEIIQ